MIKSGKEEFTKTEFLKNTKCEEGIELNGAKATLVAVSTNDSQIRLALRWMKGWFPLGKKYMYMVY